MSERNGGGGGFFFGLVIGGLIGGAIGLLLAPRPGQETVKVIREKGTEWRAKGETAMGDDGRGLRDMAEDVREIVREAVEEAREVLNDAMAQGREARERATAELQKEFEQARQTPGATGPAV